MDSAVWIASPTPSMHSYGARLEFLFFGLLTYLDNILVF